MHTDTAAPVRYSTAPGQVALAEAKVAQTRRLMEAAEAAGDFATAAAHLATLGRDLDRLAALTA